jgi:hypothetical protein
MALTWSHLFIILNCSALFFSLSLVGLSPAILYLISHGMHRMNKQWPQGYYEWYRGPSWDIDTLHKVKLTYDSSNDYMLFAAGSVGVITGVVGIVGFFLTRQVSIHPLTPGRRDTDEQRRQTSPPPRKRHSSCRSFPAASPSS